MRTFLKSKFARATSQSVIASLLVNILVIAFPVSRAEAQFSTTRSQWAVVDFVNKSGVGGDALGGVASDAVTTLLIGSNRADLIEKESVDRVIDELQLSKPITNKLELLRLGQAIGAEVVITGEVQKARINKGANGKSADVVLLVRGIDVASGLSVLGTAEFGQSAERPGDVSDDAVLNEAINFAAQKSVTTIIQQQIGVATVLATPTSKFVKINKGSRDGIKVGMDMVVTRGREQVATIHISDVSTQEAEATVRSSIKGVAPGDKARVLYDKLPEIQLTARGPRTRTVRRGDTTGALLAVLVVGLIALTMNKGQGNSPGEFWTEAALAEDGVSPVVKCSWHPNIFNLGTQNRVEWQVWRTDYADTPVEVVPGSFNSVYDRAAARTRNWRDMGSIVGGPACVEDPGQEAFENPAPGIIPGTTYMYTLSLVYKLSSLDVPGAETGGEITDCFFTTTREPAKGPSTPLDQATLISPPNGATDVNNTVQFSWTAVPGANQYAVEISTSPTFSNANNVRLIATVESILPGSVSTDPIDISGVFPASQRLYWRVGARNSADIPGPVKDILGLRYVQSLPNQFDRVTPPPPPPSN